MTEQSKPPSNWYRALPILAGVGVFVAFGVILGLLVRPGSAGWFEPPEQTSIVQPFKPTKIRPKLVIKPKPGAGAVNLAGSVVDQAGRPVALAAVSANFELGPGVTGTNTGGHPEVVAVADQHGRFTLVGLDAGRYRLKVEGDDIFTSEVRFLDVPRDAIKLIVARIVEVQGVVIVGNTPMADVEVSLRGDSGKVEKIVSGRDGRFAFVGLSEGVYQVWVAAGDQAAAVQRVSRLGTGPFADVVLQVEPASIVHGVVRDKGSGQGVAAALVLRSVDLEEPPRYATSRGDGSFSIEGVPNGRWIADAYAPGYLMQESVTFTAGSRYSPTLFVVRGGVAQGRVVDQHGGSVAGAVITLRSGAKVTVSESARAHRLQSYQGQAVTTPSAGPRFIQRGELGVMLGRIPYPPPAGAVVTAAMTPDEKPATAAGDNPPGTADDKPLVVRRELQSAFKTDHDGRFRVTGLAAGRYRVFAAHPRYASAMTKPFAIVVGKAKTGLRVVLSPGVMLIGKVTDKRGEPILGAVVRAVAVKNTHPDIQAVTATDGTYQLGPLAHNATLHVGAVNHGDVTRKFRVGQTSIAVIRRTENFVLTSANAQLRGRVIDPSGFAVRGAAVVVVSKGAALNRDATSDANGLFKIDNLAAATYRVRVQHPGYPVLTRALATEKDTDISLTFGGGIEGFVRDGHTGAALDGARVNATGPHKARYDTSAQQNGAIKLGPLTPGTWQLTVNVPGYVSVIKSVAVPRSDKPAGVTVRDLRIELRRGAIVEGTVRNVDGERIRAAKVWVATQPSSTTKTDEHGRFRLADVPTGEIVIKASRNGKTGKATVALRPGDHVGTVEIDLKD